jgi:sulfur relay protein TusB/DsrH
LKTLHLITQAIIPGDLQDFVRPYDALVFLSEGTYLISGPGIDEIARLTEKRFIVDEDLAVRGLENSSSDIHTIGYEKLVNLVMEFDRSLTW